MPERIFVLTGAGVSAESGLGTFRDAGGLWEEYDLEDVATPEGYARDPDLVLGFYNARRETCAGAEPNAAHRALARLEREWPGRLTLVTQNIDDLHERAGHRNVLHMHGDIMRALCAGCGERWDCSGPMRRADACPACVRPGGVRPDVVWFGEMPYLMDEIWPLLAAADLFVAIGTSGEVYPAAGFVAEATASGAHTLEINLEPTASAFDERLTGPASRSVPAWVETLLAGRGGGA